jgi:hypothetical protein
VLGQGFLTLHADDPDAKASAKALQVIDLFAPGNTVSTDTGACRFPAGVKKAQGLAITAGGKALYFYTDDPEHTATWVETLSRAAHVRLPTSTTSAHDATLASGWGVHVLGARGAEEEVC